MSINELFYFTNQKIHLHNSEKDKLNQINSENAYSEISNSKKVLLKDITLKADDNEISDCVDINQAMEKILTLDKEENLMQIYIDTLFEEENKFKPEEDTVTSCFKDDNRIKTDENGTQYVTVEEIGIDNTNDSINSIISNSYDVHAMEISGYSREDLTDLIIRENHLKNMDDIETGQQIILPSFYVPGLNPDSIEIDDNGNTIHSFFDDDGNFKQNITDMQNRVIQSSCFDEEYRLKSTTNYEYDDDGNITSTKTTYFDKKGNIVSEE